MLLLLIKISYKMTDALPVLFEGDGVKVGGAYFDHEQSSRT